MSNAAIVLAAGRGTRMRSARPKVLHEICGRPLIGHVVGAALAAGVTDCIVVLDSATDEVARYLRDAFAERVRTVVQAEPGGSGRALATGLAALGDREYVFVLSGDVPFVEANDLQRLQDALHAKYQLARLMCGP